MKPGMVYSCQSRAGSSLPVLGVREEVCSIYSEAGACAYWRLGVNFGSRSLVLQKLAVLAKPAGQIVPSILLSQHQALRLPAHATCLSCYIWAASTFSAEMSQHAVFWLLGISPKERGI